MRPLTGCARGCPLDHHEPPCPRALPAPWDAPRAADVDQAYDNGYRAAARRFYDLGVAAGINATADLPQEPPEEDQ